MPNSKIEVEVLQRYRHDLKPGNEETLCGLTPDDSLTMELKIACDCGHPLCEKPPTCPVCLQVSGGKVN